MSRPVANVDVITDSFEIWLLETNELLHALSTEIITANSTYANTGNTAFPRTAQLYGTFGANNLVVKDWMKGGNVNGQFANLMISTNTVLSNTTATEIRLEVANGSSNTFMWQYGLHAGLTGANLIANTTKLTIQSNSTTNTTATAFAVVAANSTNTATMNPISFSTGLFVANTIQITLGANVTANATNGGTIQVTGSGAVGNSVSNSSGLYVGNTITNSQMTSVRFFAAAGSNTVLANNQIISIANTTSSANIDPISFKTGIFTGNTIAASVGANLIANSSALYIGNSTINAIHTQTSTVLQNSIHSATMTLTRFEVGNSTINALANSTIIRIANSTSSANVDPISFKTGIFTGNTIAVSVGANVVANSSALYVGNSTVNTVTTQTSTVIANSTQNTSIGINTITLGNTSVNTQITQALLRVANATVSANQSTAGFTTGIFTANQTVVAVGANVFANATSLLVGNSSFNTIVGNGSITASANLTITPTSHLVVVGAATVSSNVALANTLSVAGAANVLSTLGVTGAATLSSTLGVTGAATLSNTIAVTGTASYANIVTFKTEHVLDVFANGNLGATTGTDVLVFQYPKADYSSAKLLIQMKNAGNTQISEALVAHDTTTAQLTTYGTVSAPVSSNSGVSLLGTFSANVDTTNVRVYVKQTRANTAAKVVAQFIK